ncbi:MAG TPA: MFS transporter, partial [Streptosporangiaceae bacterium]|nr:MFS transporter [Streptosporangiaceae bacterium]
MPDSVTSRRQVSADPSDHRLTAAVLLVGIVMLAFNLRAAITSLPPLFPELATHLHLSLAAVALLAATPALCFAAFSGTAAPLSRWFGEERVLLAALVLLAAGLVLRGAAPHWLLFPGTVLACAAIALMNVLLPSLIKRRDPARAGWLIGIYLLSMSAGAVLAALLAVPVFTASGGSVPLALAGWALPAIVATGVWLPQLRFRTAPAGPAGARLVGPPRLKVTRYWLTWQVMAFMGLQSLVYYAALSWMPTLFRDRGVSAVQAGTLLALMQLGGAGTSLLLPVLAHRSRDQRWLTGVVVAVAAVGLAGAAFAPVGGAAGWVLVLGAGQGAALGLAIYFTMARAPDPVAAASLSAFAQGAGYLVASAGPLMVGFL